MFWKHFNVFKNDMIVLKQKGKQKCYPKINNLEYKHLDQDRANMLNLISIYDFLIKY